MKTLFIISIIIYLFHIYVTSTKALHMLQQNRYNRGYRYIKWIFNHYNENFINTKLIFLFFILTTITPNLNNLSPFIFIIIYAAITYIFIDERSKESYKLPLKYTSRIKKLMATNIILYAIPCLIMILIFNERDLSKYYFILGMLSYLNYFIILFANFINRPIDYLISEYYKDKTKKKLSSMPTMSVIGITGSYGKTSTKNVVYEILNSKYNVYKTPANYNTPYGLMLTINNELDIYNDYFIAEMGACKKGDIKELCDLVSPKYGILTTIGVAHLETFGSEENIENTKFELIESLPKDGIAVLNGDDEKQISHHIHNTCEKVWIGINNKKVDYLAKEIKLSSKGTTFKLKIKDLKTEYTFETKLLGESNIYNILEGIALGHKLGINIKDLQKAVKRLEAVEHRLSMIKYKSINIIDDAYNSNPIGSKMALDVLNMMPGKHIVVTPGMIEIGHKEFEINKEFGSYMSKKVDEVILIGQEKTKPIYEGLIENKFPEKKIHVLNDVLDAFPLMEKLSDKETYVLLENDLPDSFNEKIRSDK